MRCRPAFPACLRLVSSVPSHLIGHHLARPSPRSSTRLAGREAGSVCALLAWFCPAVCADVDKPVHAVSSTVPPRSACLFGSAAGERCSHLVVWDVLRCPACPSARLVSRLVRRLVGRAGSCVSRPVLRHGGRGVGGCGATAACFRSSF